MKKLKLLFISIIVLLFSSCVSMKQYKETSGKLDNLKLENNKLQKELMDLSTKSTELEAKVALLTQKKQCPY